MMNLRAEVIYKGQPFPDAVVKLAPHEFLGPNVLPAEGVTRPLRLRFSIDSQRVLA